MSDPALDAPVLSFDDLYALPDDGRRYELLAGRLLSEPLPGTRLVVTAVCGLLQTWARPGGTGVVLTGDAGFVLARLPDTVRGPDVAWISMTRVEKVGSCASAFRGPPDLAVEVLSPGDRPAEVHAKVADYLAAGTRLAWVVDPVERRVTVYRTLLSPRVPGADDRLCDEEVLPGFEATVGELFLV